MISCWQPNAEYIAQIAGLQDDLHRAAIRYLALELIHTGRMTTVVDPAVLAKARELCDCQACKAVDC